jgi:mannosyltransferase OCH1-like enzyme
VFQGCVEVIPKIIHHVFFRGADKLSAADSLASKRLRERNPGWEYRFYDEEAAVSWVEEHCEPRVRTAFHLIDPAYYAARSDLLRYLLCYEHGGVYLDVKSDASLPLDEVLRTDDEYILSQWAELRHRPAGAGNHRDLDHVPGDEFVQWFIVSAPHHPFLRDVISDVVRNIETYSAFREGVGRMGVLRTTGPIAYTRTIYPLLGAYPHRLVAFESDLGLVYSRYGDHESHRRVYRTHYEDLTGPVIRSGPVSAMAANIWYGRMRPALERNISRAKKVSAYLV